MGGGRSEARGEGGGVKRLGREGWDGASDRAVVQGTGHRAQGKRRKGAYDRDGMGVS